MCVCVRACVRTGIYVYLHNVYVHVGVCVHVDVCACACVCSCMFTPVSACYRKFSQGQEELAQTVNGACTFI